MFGHPERPCGPLSANVRRVEDLVERGSFDSPFLFLVLQNDTRVAKRYKQNATERNATKASSEKCQNLLTLFELVANDLECERAKKSALQRSDR